MGGTGVVLAWLEGGAGAGGPPPPPLESEDNPAILKTTPKQIVLKPPSSKHKPGIIKTQKKRKLTNTDVPINQRKINTMFKSKLDKTTQNVTSNPTIVTTSDRMDRKDGQSNSLSSACQNPCQKLEDKELRFLYQDQKTCPDLGESNKLSFSLL